MTQGQDRSFTGGLTANRVVKSISRVAGNPFAGNRLLGNPNGASSMKPIQFQRFLGPCRPLYRARLSFCTCKLYPTSDTFFLLLEVPFAWESQVEWKIVPSLRDELWFFQPSFHLREREFFRENRSRRSHENDESLQFYFILKFTCRETYRDHKRK